MSKVFTFVLVVVLGFALCSIAEAGGRRGSSCGCGSCSCAPGDSCGCVRWDGKSWVKVELPAPTIVLPAPAPLVEVDACFGLFGRGGHSGCRGGHCGGHGRRHR